MAGRDHKGDVESNAKSFAFFVIFVVYLGCRKTDRGPSRATACQHYYYDAQGVLHYIAGRMGN